MDIARAGAGASTDATSARITVVVVVASALVAARARRRRRASRTFEPSRGVIIVVIIVVVVVDPLARSSSRVVVVVVAVVMLVLVERERRARECRVESRRVASRRIASNRLIPLFRFFIYRAYHPPDGLLELTLLVPETYSICRHRRVRVPFHTVRECSCTGDESSTSDDRWVCGCGCGCGHGTVRSTDRAPALDGGERRRR